MDLRNCKINTTSKTELKAKADELLKKFIEFTNKGEFEKARSYRMDVDDVCNFYTSCSKKDVYTKAVTSGNSMKYLVNTFTFDSIKVKETPDKEDENVIEYSIIDIEKPIDLTDAYKQIEGGIGADTKWFYTAERLNYYLTIRAAERVGATVDVDSYQMNKIAREISLGKTPCSNTNMLKTLQLIIDQMLGSGYKATSHDVNYLVDCYSNDNKKSKTALTAANHKTLRNYLKKICYRTLNGLDGYSVESKEIKPEKK